MLLAWSRLEFGILAQVGSTLFHVMWDMFDDFLAFVIVIWGFGLLRGLTVRPEHRHWHPKRSTQIIPGLGWLACSCQPQKSWQGSRFATMGWCTGSKLWVRSQTFACWPARQRLHVRINTTTLGNARDFTVAWRSRQDTAY